MNDLKLRIAGAAGVAVMALVPLAVDARSAAGSTVAALGARIAHSKVLDLGRAAAATPVAIAVTLAYRNESELEGLVALQASPASPMFGHFLSPAQFAAAFAPTPATYAGVARTLQAAGFTITGLYSNRTVIDARAGAAVAERFFGTQIHRFAQPGHGIRYANVTAGTIPAAIAPAVDTVLGLDNIVKFASHRVRAARSTTHVAAGMQKPLLSGPIERIVDGVFNGLYPTGIAKAYNYPAQAGFTGTGHGLDIVIDSDIADSDLTTFWSAAGIKRTGSFTRVFVDGANPGINGDVGETAIDTEMTSSLAPGANIYLSLISSLADAPIEDAYALAVTHPTVDVVSSSFGGCEPDDIPFSRVTDRIALQGAAVGVTFTASTGDSGGYCEDQGLSGPPYFEPDIVSNPASDPHFIAVGGTTLTVDPNTGARTSETAWSPGGFDGGGGGGVSSYWPLPSYQAGVRGMITVPTIRVSPPDSQPNSGFAGRNLPDISLDASNGDGSYVAVYDTPDGGWTGYGGTSVSNPLFAALIVELNEKFHIKAGFANPRLYSIYTAGGKHPAGVYGADFLDITGGDIGGFAAHSGYDQATGIGSIENGMF